MATSFHPFAVVPAWLLCLSGCSSSQKRTPVAPTSLPLQQTYQVAIPPAPTVQTPTTTQVHIDDAILKACGIKSDQAFFAFDSAKLESLDAKPLSDVAACFTTGPMKGKSLKLIGRADPRGEHEYNMVLGQSRADTVSSFLRGKGLGDSHISTTSRGAINARGTDEAGWSKDRRVDVMLGS
jgi:peptidoglycan-associated lipoprotein